MMSMSLRTHKKSACLVVGIALLAATSSWGSIIGGDANSILSTDTRSIVGGDLDSIIGSDFAAIGPVEALDARKSVIVVLGQSFAINQATKFGANSLGVKALKLLRVGDYVAVSGSNSAAGLALAITILPLRTSYVSGSSQAYVKGRIGSLDAALGRLNIGSLTVDYTAVLSSLDASSFSVGSVVEFSGIRPNQAGQLLAFSARVPESSSIIGGDTNSIIGGDTSGKSIIGGDTSGKSIIGGDTSGKSIIGGDTSVNAIFAGDTSG
jgi:hypothetical protein